MTERTPVALSVDGTVARIVVGDGARHNALDGEGWAELGRVVRNLADLDALRVAVISGHGASFCAGSDVTEWIDAATDSVEGSFSRMESAFSAVEECHVPVVAKITGVAAGAGCQLALACDLRIMSASATIGMPIARLGILPSTLFTARIVELAGPAVARELLYTGKLVGAQTAVSCGLANVCVPDPELEGYTAQVLSQICEQPPAAIAAAKRAVATVLRPTREAGDDQRQRAVSEADFRRGINKFLRG
ncbi:MAG: enoyl-CoA hydratase/isomerase family protein [Sciscionella sp.]